MAVKQQIVVAAVSGGIDSVVLLDTLVQQGEHRVIVAHFDHGIRPDSAEDARFVRQLAERYGLVFETAREELGAAASEQLARERRYRFLQAVAAAYDARVATAHHQDDLIETISINLIRGTGWRGLAPMRSAVWRPLLGMTKGEIVRYAIEQGLEWREDATNNDLRYLRNQVRAVAGVLPAATVRRLVELYRRQTVLRDEIESELAHIAANVAQYSDGVWRLQRYYLVMLPSTVAMELLGHLVGGRLTRPQLARVLLYGKVAHPHKQLSVGAVVFAAEKQFISISIRSHSIVAGHLRW